MAHHKVTHKLALEFFDAFQKRIMPLPPQEQLVIVHYTTKIKLKNKS